MLPLDLTKAKNVYRIWIFSKMLIRERILTISGFLETVSGGRKHFHLTDNSRKHVQDLKYFKNVDSRRRLPVLWKPFLKVVNASTGLDKVENVYRIWIFSKMLIRDENPFLVVVNASIWLDKSRKHASDLNFVLENVDSGRRLPVLETISGGRKHFCLTDNSWKHVQDLKFFQKCWLETTFINYFRFSGNHFWRL